MKSFKELLYITELFDNPAPFDKNAGDGSYSYTATINGKELKLKCTLTVPLNYWHVYFSVDGETKITFSDGNEIVIFSTVLAMLKDFSDSESPEKIMIIAKSSEESRVSLYDKLIKIFGRKHGYELVKKETSRKNDTYLIHKV